MKKDWLLYALFAAWALSALVGVSAIIFVIGSIATGNLVMAFTSFFMLVIGWAASDYFVTTITKRLGDEP